ncbi:MAG: tol-pal system protein YbgF [Pseudomonadota bacterium]
MAWALAVLAPAPASAQSPERVLRKLDNLQEELDEIRADLGVQTGRRDGGAMAATLRRLDLIEAELVRLTGEVERLGYRMDRIAQDATRRFGDIEFRLTELEGGDIAALPPEPPLLGGPGEGADAGPATSVSERRALDDAVSLIQRGQIVDAESALVQFRESYPDSPLLPEAQYQLGEARFTQGDFRLAARAYLDGFNAAPSGERAPDSLLKLGVSLGRLGQLPQACNTLREIPRRFPGNDRVIAEAEGEASRLACG